MFIIREIQTANGTPTFLPDEIRSTRAEAESVFYYKCGSACVSHVPTHTIMTYTEEGFVIPELTKCFKHPTLEEESA